MRYLLCSQVRGVHLSYQVTEILVTENDIIKEFAKDRSTLTLLGNEQIETDDDEGN